MSKMLVYWLDDVALLVITSIFCDFMNGLKLLKLCPSFVASAIITLITNLALWTSAAYKRAIVMTSTELIVNAVIPLFVNDIEKQIYNAV
jgi:hypothetical protein